MLTSCLRLLTRIARQPATFFSHFSARQRFLRTHHISGISATEFSTMSENGEWKNVKNSGKSKKRKSPEKSNENRPQTANGTASNVARGGAGATKKEPKAEEVNTKAAGEASPAKDGSCPWLGISDDSDDGAKPTVATTPDSSKGGKKKRTKKKKSKNKDRPEPEEERDAKTAKVEQDKTAESQVTNGATPDADEPTTDSKPESEEVTEEEPTAVATSTEPSEGTKPDDGAASLDDTPMSWDDGIEDENNASNETEPPSAADGEGPSASQTTNKENESAESGAGKEPDKKSKEAGGNQKVSMKWHKSPVRSTDRMKGEAPARDRVESSDQKHPKPFKKPRTDSANEGSRAKGNLRDDSHERKSGNDAASKAKENSSDQKERERERSRDKRSDSSGRASQDSERSRSKGDHSRERSHSEGRMGHGSKDRKKSAAEKEPRNAAGDQRSSGAGQWEKSGKRGKNNANKADQGHDKRVKKGGQSSGPERQKESRWSSAEPAPPEGFQLIEIKGDLFSCARDDAMAHCVSEDLEMGKGIAVHFKKMFGGVGKLRAQGKKVGEVAVLPADDSFIYYLITKERYFHKPTYEALRSTLEAMRDHCRENNITSIAMPQIGCGLDKLNWGVVTEMIKEIFKNTGMTIKIYIYSG